MIKKETLLKKLDGLILMEEVLIPSLRDQLPAALSFINANKEQKEIFQQKLQQLTDREQKHVTLLKELKNDIDQKTDMTF